MSATLLGLAALGTAGLGGLLFTILGVDSRALTRPCRGPEILVVLAATGLLVYAAGMFARRNIREADGIAALLALATVLMAGAALSQLAVLPAQGIGPADALRVVRIRADPGLGGHAGASSQGAGGQDRGGL